MSEDNEIKIIDAKCFNGILKSEEILCTTAEMASACHPKGSPSYEASKINLANPGTNDAVDGIAPTWHEEMAEKDNDPNA